MKRILFAAVATVGLVSAAAATSVTTTTTTGGTAVTTGSTSATVTLQPEVRTKIKQYVTTSKPKAVAVPSGFTVRQGVKLPETVEIQSFPSEVGVTQYSYAVVGDQTVLVNPNREIVEVIQ